MNTRRIATLHDEPAYRASDVADILALPAATVKAWAFGQDYSYRDGQPKRFIKLIEAADSRRRYLSFTNLCELYVLSALRRGHRIPMPVVRDSLAFGRPALTRAGVKTEVIADRFVTGDDPADMAEERSAWPLFPLASPDEVWLEGVAGKGWLVVLRRVSELCNGTTTELLIGCRTSANNVGVCLGSGGVPLAAAPTAR